MVYFLSVYTGRYGLGRRVISLNIVPYKSSGISQFDEISLMNRHDIAGEVIFSSDTYLA